MSNFKKSTPYGMFEAKTIKHKDGLIYEFRQEMYSIVVPFDVATQLVEWLNSSLPKATEEDEAAAVVRKIKKDRSKNT